jgi:hypothetical protein
MTSRALLRAMRIAGTAMCLLLLTSGGSAWAQNTTSGASYGYVVGQGPINIFIGNSAGTDTERWYTTSLVGGKSYCLENYRANSEYGIDLDLDFSLIRVSDNVNLGTYNGFSTHDPSLGNNSRWTRGCLIAPATQQYYVRIHKSVCCTGRSGNFQFRIVDTTLHSPWWSTDAGSQYEAYVLVANTSTNSVTTTITVRSASGSTLGTTTFALPAGGNTFRQVSLDFGSFIQGQGNAQIAHTGPPGSIVANITTLSPMTGLSFDAPFQVRQGYQ